MDRDSPELWQWPQPRLPAVVRPSRLKPLRQKDFRPSRLTLILLLILTATIAQSEDWAYYGFDQGGTRFSPLQQIDRSNIANLEVAWTHRYGDLPKYADRSQF
ncbi:MAG: hypothetical protein QGH93_04195, partial [Gammaproteobacteria bacterium]|nr:hypothetical protein [Gammaproteobacteria bacterium]